jgi:hypothetical protein
LDPSKRVVIPVVWREGRLEPFYGGELPKFRDGWVMDLVTEEDALENKGEINRFNIEHEVMILQKEATLYAVISMRLWDAKKMPAPPVVDLDTIPLIPAESILVPFIIKQDLKLHLRGTRPAELLPCRCEVGLKDINDPESVNQAYTRLSEYYEPWRRAHTGNVFDKVYFQDKPGVASPLRVLRDEKEAEAEKQLFHLSGQLPLA